MEFLPYAILLGLIMFGVWSVPRDTKAYKDFLKVDDTESRQKFFKKWVIESFLIYGTSAIVFLILLGKGHHLYQFPEYLLDIASEMNPGVEEDGEGSFMHSFFSGFSASVIPTVLIAVPLVTLLFTYVTHKTPEKPEEEKIKDPREIAALFPRNNKEIFWMSMLSINAGFSEELFFRLLAPLLIFLITGSATIAIIASTIWFGLVHHYQGIVGILVTSFVGLLMFWIFLTTQNIWMAVLAHAILDLKDFSFAPLFKSWLEKRAI